MPIIPAFGIVPWNAVAPWRPEEGVRAHEVGVTNLCELLDMGTWRANPSQEQYILLATEPPFQPSSFPLVDH